MRSFGIRGIPIGAVSSQTIGNLATSRVDHLMKRNGKKKGYFRYCDDVLGLAKTKAEAIRDMKAFRKESMNETGVVLKANAVVSPIGRNITDDEKRKRKKKRKRQRGGRWKKH